MKLVEATGLSVARAAKQLSMPKSSVDNWVRASREGKLAEVGKGSDSRANWNWIGEWLTRLAQAPAVAACTNECPAGSPDQGGARANAADLRPRATASRPR
ncbi:MAG: hypothetical protein JNL68_20430 [Burkholderiales bacterium]|nr:hypothetical protein [Burkholderiales bacterium]